MTAHGLPAGDTKPNVSRGPTTDCAQIPTPRCGKEITRAHSLPGLSQSLLRRADGPQTGWWCAPSGPIASRVSGNPVPVIRQTIFS